MCSNRPWAHGLTVLMHHHVYRYKVLHNAPAGWALTTGMYSDEPMRDFGQKMGGGVG